MAHFGAVSAGQRYIKTYHFTHDQTEWEVVEVKTVGAALPHAQLVIRKGYLKDIDSYSAFCMVDGTTKTGLASYLNERDIKRIFVAGCAVDYCVGGLATDAVKEGFETFIVDDATASIDPAPGASADKAWEDTAAAGVRRIASVELV